ncbi:ribonuclease HI [Vibrio cyclitrophicus]|uniref:ribonuclease HI n=1 Tax=Vibrio cyclitrophicus TaxID=47951 RepID=UPI0007EEA906|nr:ribonuclease HI [Vibrio cyclitrophicus]OBT02697.1 ribonuclease HI [Vibrio cyclitrophicus]
MTNKTNNFSVDVVNHAYTDGACSGNPGIGGWGFVLTRGDKRLERKGGEKQTTNNQMELTAAIKALKELQDRYPQNPIVVHTDSQYVHRGISEWIENWKRNGWRTAAKKSVLNKDLWVQLDELNQAMNVTWEWVKSHSGNIENERADALAQMGKRLAA